VLQHMTLVYQKHVSTQRVVLWTTDIWVITTRTNFAFYCKLTAFLKYPERTLGQAYTKLGLSNIYVCRLWRLKAILSGHNHAVS